MAALTFEVVVRAHIGGKLVEQNEKVQGCGF